MFQYKFCQWPVSQFEDGANQLGAQGWEMIAVFSSSLAGDYLKAVFKRGVRPAAQAIPEAPKGAKNARSPGR